MSYFRKIANRMANARQSGSLKPVITPDSIPPPMKGNMRVGRVSEPSTRIFQYAERQPLSTQSKEPKLAAGKDEEKEFSERAGIKPENTEILAANLIDSQKPKNQVPNTQQKVDSIPAAPDQSQMKFSQPASNSTVANSDIAHDKNDSASSNTPSISPPNSSRDNDKQVDSVGSLATEPQKILKSDEAKHDLRVERVQSRNDDDSDIKLPEDSSSQEQYPLSHASSKSIPEVKPTTTHNFTEKYTSAISEQKEETIITINIGRIEVRAPTAQSDPKPFARKEYAPSLSLNEYLKQRSEANKT